MNNIKGLLFKKYYPVSPNHKFKVMLEVNFFDEIKRANSMFIQYYTKQHIGHDEVKTVFDQYQEGDSVEANIIFKSVYVEKAAAHFNYIFINNLWLREKSVIEDGLLIESDVENVNYNSLGNSYY